VENPFTHLGTIAVPRSERARWKTGELPLEWSARYPKLFDGDDLRLTTTQPNLHFYEWFGAVELHRQTRYLSLVEKYEFGASSGARVHRRKQEIVARLLPLRVRDALCDRTPGRRAQAPDLLMYAEDHSDWFFCEVKGPGDRLRDEQIRKFEWLAEMSSNPVRLLEIRLT
jgi:hypothetical protein